MQRLLKVLPLMVGLTALMAVGCGESPTAPPEASVRSVTSSEAPASSATLVNPYDPARLALLRTPHRGPRILAPVPLPAGDVRAMSSSDGVLKFYGTIYQDDWDSGARVGEGFYLWTKPVGGSNTLRQFVNNPEPGLDGYVEVTLPAGTYIVTYNNIPEMTYPTLCNPSIPSFQVTIVGGNITQGTLTWDDMTTCDMA